MTLLYQPYYRVTGTTAWTAFGSPTAATSEAITGLQPNTDYDFEVVAVNSFGSATSAVASAFTATTSGAAPAGSVAGTQTVGTTAPIITGPLSGTVLVSGTLAITGVLITDNNVRILFGSTNTIIDSSGNVWSINAANNGEVYENGKAQVFSSNTAQVVYKAGVIYQANNSNQWYSWNGSNWTATNTVPISSGYTLTVTTTAGTLTMPGSNVTGRGTASVSLVDTLANTLTAASGIVLTAPNTVTSVNVKISFFDIIGNSQSITVTVGVVAPVAPSPPTSLLVIDTATQVQGSGTLPSQPANVAASNPTLNAITLTWIGSQGTAPITYLPWFRVTGSSTFTPFGSQINDPTVTATVTGLTSGTSFDFEIQATNATGNVFSAIVTASTQAVIAPSQPVNLVPSHISQTQVTLTWTGSQGTAPITYQPQFKVSTASTFSNFGPPISDPTTTVAITGLTAGTAYSFAIKAQNAGGSNLSPIVSATTLATGVSALGPFALVLADTSVSNQMSAYWSQPSGSTSPMTFSVYASASSPTGPFTLYAQVVDLYSAVLSTGG